MPALPEGAREGITKGLYCFRPAAATGKHRVQLLGSGPILREALRAQVILAERFQIAADVWSATSFSELHREAMIIERWNRLHPSERTRIPYVTACLAETDGPIIAATDYVRTLPEMIARWVPRDFTCLGTDGFGCSDTRPALRRLFEVDAEHITIAALFALAREGRLESAQVRDAIKILGIDPDGRGPIGIY
jgi:pyruvate dehydrogenase E1 component